MHILTKHEPELDMVVTVEFGTPSSVGIVQKRMSTLITFACGKQVRTPVSKRNLLRDKARKYYQLYLKDGFTSSEETPNYLLN